MKRLMFPVPKHLEDAARRDWAKPARKTQKKKRPQKRPPVAYREGLRRGHSWATSASSLERDRLVAAWHAKRSEWSENDDTRYVAWSVAAAVRGKNCSSAMFWAESVGEEEPGLEAVRGFVDGAADAIMEEEK